MLVVSFSLIHIAGAHHVSDVQRRATVIAPIKAAIAPRAMPLEPALFPGAMVADAVPLGAPVLVGMAASEIAQLSREQIVAVTVTETITSLSEELAIVWSDD